MNSLSLSIYIYTYSIHSLSPQIRNCSTKKSATKEVKLDNTRYLVSRTSNMFKIIDLSNPLYTSACNYTPLMDMYIKSGHSVISFYQDPCFCWSWIFWLKLPSRSARPVSVVAMCWNIAPEDDDVLEELDEGHQKEPTENLLAGWVS